MVWWSQTRLTQQIFCFTGPKLFRPLPIASSKLCKSISFQHASSLYKMLWERIFQPCSWTDLKTNFQHGAKLWTEAQIQEKEWGTLPAVTFPLLWPGLCHLSQKRMFPLLFFIFWRKRKIHCLFGKHHLYYIRCEEFLLKQIYCKLWFAMKFGVATMMIIDWAPQWT